MAGQVGRDWAGRVWAVYGKAGSGMAGVARFGKVSRVRAGRGRRGDVRRGKAGKVRHGVMRLCKARSGTAGKSR